MTFSEKFNKIKSVATVELSCIEELLTKNIVVREPLNQSLKNFLNQPSKRIRSLLSILYLKANNENLNVNQTEFLSVIELIHNASLIHDDIIDECSTRRGQKTIGAEFDNKLAVISGDYILSVAMEKLTKIGDINLIKKISQTIKQMCIGEINQNFDRFKIGTIEQYIDKTCNKTAYLFETALTGTMQLCKKNYDLKNIAEFGLNIGIAFQIRDDILNITQKDKEKPSQNDITEGIYNAPVIYGTENDNYQSGIEKTKILLNNYVNEAENLIVELPTNKYSEAIKDFLELLKDV